MPLFRFLVILALLSWSGVYADIVSGKNSLTIFAIRRRVNTLPPLDLGAVVKNRPLRGGDIATASTKAVFKSIFFESVKQTFQELTEGDFTWKEIVFFFLAVASVGLSFSAMILLEGSYVVDLLAWTCLVVGISAAILQRKVSLLESMRELTNQLREEVGEMTASNSVLKSQNRRLSKNTQKLKNTQSTLEKISESQGITVDKLVDQVNEYRKIQESIQIDLQSRIQQTLLSVFMRSDRDEDYIIDPEEVNQLIYRLNSIPSVTFDETKFRKALKKEGGDVMKFANKHIHGKTKNGIFQF